MRRADLLKNRLKVSGIGRALKRLRRGLRIGMMRWTGAVTPKSEILSYQCNICGQRLFSREENLKREQWSCPYCGSTVRFRSMIHSLSLELFGQSIPLPDFPIRKNISGLGMSDWDGYALPLAEKLGYTNAFYHQEPFFDITEPPDDWVDRYDFVVSSDVMEHVAPPIQYAFDNLFRILRPGGFLVLSVPFVREQSTSEHFPDLHRYEMLEEAGMWVLRNKNKDGAEIIYRNLTFHGGPGTTVEMRVFGREDLLQNLAKAGFTEIEVMEAPESRYGILWNRHNPSDDPYDKPILGLDAPPIIARKPN